ncbi:MAG: glycosyltransferase family protein [Betaproteobacteria bacterium]|nr:glycosyltransferase family protein [Betaproteobacteria bacterium]
MKVVIIDQARMTSTRLPGKVLKEVACRPLLEYQIERLRRVQNAHEVVIATTKNATDDPIIGLCERLGVSTYRGSEEDVLQRYYEAARAHGADVVVRVTSDCPVIDPAVVDAAIAMFLAPPMLYDYVSNTQARSYPRGLDVEVFSFAALAAAQTEGRLEYEREHVTPYLYQHPERFRIGQLVAGEDHSQHRWTVDTAEDFELIGRIIATLYPVNPEFDLAAMLDLLRRHPDWSEINAQVMQKQLGQ